MRSCHYTHIFHHHAIHSPHYAKWCIFAWHIVYNINACLEAAITLWTDIFRKWRSVTGHMFIILLAVQLKSDTDDFFQDAVTMKQPNPHCTLNCIQYSWGSLCLLFRISTFPDWFWYSRIRSHSWQDYFPPFSCYCTKHSEIS